MSVKPIAESLLFVPIGDSTKEYDIVYQMLLMAIVKSHDDNFDSLANVIMLIVGMRVDGVVDELISELRAENIINGIDESEVLTRNQIAIGEAYVAQYMRRAVNTLRHLILPPRGSGEGVKLKNLGMAIIYIWSMPDLALEEVRAGIENPSPEVLLTLTRPRGGETAK